MSEAQTISGVVASHTMIRIPGTVHAEHAPFVLLLVEVDDGTRRLGQFLDETPPQIGSRVVSDGVRGPTIVFRAVKET